MFVVATAEDSDSPVAMKLKKMWLKTPVSEEQAAQAVLDPALGKYSLIKKKPFLLIFFSTPKIFDALNDEFFIK